MTAFADIQEARQRRVMAIDEREVRRLLSEWISEIPPAIVIDPYGRIAGIDADDDQYYGAARGFVGDKAAHARYLEERAAAMRIIIVDSLAEPGVINLRNLT